MKNSENWRQCLDLMDVIEEWSKQEVKAIKRGIWKWFRCNYRGRGQLVVLAQGNVQLCQSEKFRKSSGMR
jgi:transcription elongation factor GreA-like protein